MNIPKYIEEFRNEITRKGYSANTVDNYCDCLSLFLRHFEGQATEPKKINEEHIREYLRSFKSRNTQRAVHSAIKCFYHFTLHQPHKFRYIEYAKKDSRLPIVFSVDEMQALITASGANLKHKAIICLLYSTGLRVGELLNLRPEHIDGKRMIIYVVAGKGGKDRPVPLDPKLLDLLHSYYCQYRPQGGYLFQGQSGPQYSERSINQFLKKYAAAAGIRKHIHAHLLRHSYATHVLEAGGDMAILQKLLGHKNIKTTHIYAHTSDRFISQVKTPLAGIHL